MNKIFYTLLAFAAFSLCACACACKKGAGDGSGDIIVTPEPPKQSKYILSGYIPEYRINSSSPGDLSYLRVPDRLYFFGYYPTTTGAWQLFSNAAAKLNTVRAVMETRQEIFIVAGGGASATPNMHVMGTDPAKREAYAEALVNYAHQNNFDGIDMDWETDWSTSPATRVNVDDFLDLMTRVRNKMNALPSNTRVKKLTTALATQADSRELGKAIKDIVDQINVMVYDVYGTAADGYPHAPMSMFQAAMENYVIAGVPKNKLMGGVPFYGGKRTVNPTQTKPYREIYVDAGATPGAFTASSNSYNGFSFNGVNLIKEKTRFVTENDYAGMMIWELSQDLPSTNNLSLVKTMRTTIDAATE